MTAKIKNFTIRSSGLTDVGQVRENNEDAWNAVPERNVFVLADGMGGHSAGEIAAQETVERYSSLIQSKNPEISLENVKQQLNAIISEVNKSVFRLARADRELRGMGTTICSAVFIEHLMCYAHVGDSRIYRFRDQKLQQLTEDHSLVQELLDLGELNPRQASEFTQRNIITKAIGTEPDVEASIDTCDVQSGDIILMCSDGLSDLLSNREIEKILNLSADIDQKVDLFIQSANRRGGIDNITVILMEVTAHEPENLSRS